MPLSDIACKNAKPRPKLYKLSDSGGLNLRITPSGGKYWVLQYRLEGKQKDLSLGTYPTVSLVEARSARDEAKKTLREGKDPAINKITKRLESNNTRTVGLAACSIASAGLMSCVLPGESAKTRGLP